MMDLKTIFASTLLSGTVSIIVSALVTKWQADQAYKKEYYKKIIDKRFNAYEDLESVLRQLNTFLFSKELGGATFLIIETVELFDAFSIIALKSQLSMRWLSKSSQEKLAELTMIIATIGENLDSERSDHSLHAAASPYQSQLLKIKCELMDSSLHDFSELHNVGKFFNFYQKS